MFQLPKHTGDYTLVDHRYVDYTGKLIEGDHAADLRADLHAQNDALVHNPPFGNRWYDSEWLAGFVAIEWATNGEPTRRAASGYGTSWFQIMTILAESGHGDVATRIRKRQKV